MTITTDPTHLRSLKLFMLGGVSLSMMAASTMVHAQDAPASDAEQLPVEQIPTAGSDEVVATGIRRLIQDSIDLKRESTTVVDGLSADEIGGIPSLSIAEALETITSVAAEREGSGATQVSIRGLGPFLGSTVINGREATAGSGNRSVNFSQFPSELFNKIEVHKTQDASLIEGGVAGQISLSTLKPLEFGRRRVQFQAKGQVSRDNLNLTQNERDFGYRLTGSYVDQWESSIGEFGISIGAQRNVKSNPEQEARASTTSPDACRVSQFDGNSCDDGQNDAPFEFDATSGVSFEDQANAFISSNQNQAANIINPLSGLPFALDDPLFDPAVSGVDLPFVFTSSSRAFRQNITEDERDAIFGAVQWRPNDRIDINIDAQFSQRDRIEFRNDLIIDANDILAADNPDNLFQLSTSEDGNIRTATTEADVQIINLFNDFSDRYVGVGGNISFEVTDRLNFSVDGSFSDTNRRTFESQARVVSGSRPNGDNSVIAGLEVPGDRPQQITLVDFDVNDPFNFNGTGSTDLRVREDLDAFRNHTVSAIRGDVEYDFDGEIISKLKAGARFSVLEYDETPEIRIETDGSPLEIAPGITGEQIAVQCANASFPEPDFFDNEVDGDLITNITATTPGGVIDINDPSTFEVLEAGTGNTFLTFGDQCLAEAILGRDVQVPTLADITPDEQSGQVFVEEETIALYGQVDFRTELGDFPVRGNVGVRYIDTTVRTDAFRASLNVELNDLGEIVDAAGTDLQELSFVNGYSEFLPSFNVAVDVTPDVVARGGIFRALSRPDPGDLGAGRDFSFGSPDDEDDAVLSPADLVTNVVANGNQNLEPLTSWNFDLALEWYPNEDSIFAVGGYFKRFVGGFEIVETTETFTVNTVDSLTLADGEVANILDTQEVDVLVDLLTTNEDSNTIFGIEATAAHSFTYLPGIWSGLGFKTSYNYANSNFEFEDGNFGDATTLDTDGNVVSFTEGFLAPADLPGLSAHTANVQAFWKIGRGTITAIGKYRSDFFQQSNSAPTIIRFIDDALIFDARYSHNINKNIKLTLEGTNLFNSPREQQIPSLDGVGQFSVFGPRYLVGITARF